MRCSICQQGETNPGTTTITLTRGQTTVIVKAVPASVCENCGEAYLDEAVAERVMGRAEAAAGNGTELEIVQYAA